MAARGMQRAFNRFGLMLPRLVVNADGTAPANTPLHIYPSAAPTATAVAGDAYFDSTRNLLMTAAGTTFAPVQGRRVVKTAAATLTTKDSGALCLFNAASGVLYTLPTAEAGIFFDFLVTTTITSGSAKVITASASEFLVGSFLQIPDTAAQIVARAADGTTHRSWVGNGTTTGGYAGDSFRLTAISATQWAIQGIGLATGTEATPFATS